MKRIIILALAIVLLLATGYADERNLGTKCGAFWYKLNEDGTARLTACFNVDEILEVPSELDGYPVTVIGYQAFLFYSPANVVIPEGVTEIQTSAFRDNDMIRSVTLPNSLNIIDGNPFVNCPNITDIVLQDVHPAFEIDDGMLMHREEGRLVCPVNGSEAIITIPASVKVIGNRAFYNNANITQIRLHDNIVEIGDWAFCGCTNLIGIVIPPSVEYIGEYALEGVETIGVFHDTYGEKYCRENEIPFQYVD